MFTVIKKVCQVLTQAQFVNITVCHTAVMSTVVMPVSLLPGVERRQEDQDGVSSSMSASWFEVDQSRGCHGVWLRIQACVSDNSCKTAADGQRGSRGQSPAGQRAHRQ